MAGRKFRGKISAFTSHERERFRVMANSGHLTTLERLRVPWTKLETSSRGRKREKERERERRKIKNAVENWRSETILFFYRNRTFEDSWLANEWSSSEDANEGRDPSSDSISSLSSVLAILIIPTARPSDALRAKNICKIILGKSRESFVSGSSSGFPLGEILPSF